MVNESSQPKPGDAVLGGNNPPPIGAAVLGGIEGVKHRCANPDFQVRIAGLQEAVKHGEPAMELLLHGLKDEVSEVGLVAYSLLQELLKENVEPELKMALEIYEPYPHKHIHTMKLNDRADSSLVVFSPNGQLLARAVSMRNPYEKAIKVWDVETGIVTATIPYDSDRIGKLAFSPNGQLLASNSKTDWNSDDDPIIKLWNVETGMLAATLLCEDTLPGYGNSHWFVPSILAFSPNGKLLASVDPGRKCLSATIKLWDVETGKLIDILSVDSDLLRNVAFSSNGQLLALSQNGSSDWSISTIKLWDLETGMLVDTLSEHSGHSSHVAFSPNGQLIDLSREESTIKPWDDAETVTLTDLSGLHLLAFSPSRQLLATTDTRNTVANANTVTNIIQLWNTETGTLTATFSASADSSCTYLAFSPNGQLLAAGYYGGTIKLLNTETGKLIANLSIPAGNVAFSPNGQLFASVGNHDTLLWKATLLNLNIVDPIALFHSYLEIKQPQNSSLYKVIQLLNSGTKAEQEAAFSQLKSRKEPAIQALLWPYINALEPEVFHDYKLLKYFLATERWQDAKKESEKIVLNELGKELTAIQHHETSALGTLNKLSLFWEKYAVNTSSIKEQKPLNFPTQLKAQIQSIRSYKPYEPPDTDIFSRRSYSQSHD
ncbi:MAG: WD40 repeat domain-containing protein [Microcoleus sp. PH2017_10_PVI_O_A]|uniref:WD40 repeat domain-containing protein n=1 Tax=unclassified Microcoleus TaxID=2642155 RepID=UPI001DAD1982|nr:MULTISPECIES: WD40 repeat domain-containing protein [unclassified Microcoleus]TAE83309.1 MAG: WD40 repeat domain-containing protein [Oscillatoriales cyanobacterium]MCC3405301.1 WD40 repeat domain-containing protein [Microcoleus sp. PH2017_10_PVI_O_A]MCC3460416.1 WD40 repeat domain-containing protein [Microcoleus sp. PH2017_11_PCY_U_A]MCC3478702.1 WD40 repeat domain-containing protein [Microcoleus sp. PH2017_12_PCY_D_A]MCC3528373.1 WD40 repeat domain-containing protein [Microcoleus sp. PH201